MSLDAFRSWWIDRHRPMAEKLPGLRRHAFNLLAEGPYDAVVEQWFESLAAMRASYETEIGRDVVADSRKHVSARERVIAEEFVFEVSPGG
jgi:uncharacterized protein (TIGR02118 family)